MLSLNLVFRISLLIMLFQLLMSTIITPETLKISRTIIKNSELQFVSSLLKEKQFNDTVKGLTIFVDKKNVDGIYENIFIRDDGEILSKIGTSSSTIFAKSGKISDDEKHLILFDGNIQKLEKNGNISVVKFKKTTFRLDRFSSFILPLSKRI